MKYFYFSYEGGRVRENGDGSKMCAMTVFNAQDDDNGRWTCQISALDAYNNRISERGNIDVTVSGSYIFNLLLSYTWLIILIHY